MTLWSVFDAADRAAITQLLGVVISVAGVFLASPSGTARAASSAAKALTPWRRGSHHVVHLAEVVTVVSSATASAVGVAGGQRKLSPEERLDLLDARVDGVEQRLVETAAKIEADLAKMTEDLTEAKLEHERDLDALHARLTIAEDEAAMVDARALPVVLIGIVLGAADTFLGDLGVWRWALATAGAVAASVVISARVIRAHRVARARLGVGLLRN